MEEVKNRLKSMSTANKVGIGVLVVLLVVLVSMLDFSGSNRTDAPAQPVASQEAPEEEKKEPLEYKLAVINADGPVDEDDVTVKRFRFLLEKIESKTTSTKRQIADQTVGGRLLLEDNYGVQITLLEFMEYADEAIPEDFDGEYSSVVAPLIAMLGNG